MENFPQQLDDIPNEEPEIAANIVNAAAVNEPVPQNDEIPIIELFRMDEHIQDDEEQEPIEPQCEIINYETKYIRARGSYTQTFQLIKVPVMHTELNPGGPEYEEQGCLYGYYRDLQNKILASDALTIMKSNDEKSVHMNYCSHTNVLLPIIKPKRNDSNEYIYTESTKLPKRKNYDEKEEEISNKRRRN